MECQFYEFQDFGIETEDWEATKISCVATSTEGILIENGTATFWIIPSLSYGDVLVITFFMIFSVIIIAKWIAQFIFKD